MDQNHKDTVPQKPVWYVVTSRVGSRTVPLLIYQERIDAYDSLERIKVKDAKVIPVIPVSAKDVI